MIKDTTDPRLDCIHYRGEKPCLFHRECPGCTEYEPQGTRILIIKLGAMGDALRTTPILSALKKRYPRSHITWVTDAASYPLLEGIQSINRLLTLRFETRLVLEAEHFDLLCCFDKAPEATALGSLVHAKTKKGFALSLHGTLTIHDEDSRYALRLGLSDPFKFHESQRSYQDVLFEIAGLSFKGEPYELFLSEEDRAHAVNRFRRLGLTKDRPWVGLNTGCGEVFKTKSWPIESFSDLAVRLHRDAGAHVLLLGGPAEEEQNHSIESNCDVKVFNTGGDNPVKGFAAVIQACDVIITSDTLAMHLAIALGVPAVVLLGSTCPQEIDLYGKGIKLFAGVDCSPCYRQRCETMTCMTQISVEEVFRNTQKLLRGWKAK